MKTSRNIQGDVWQMLQGSDLQQSITGSVYREGMRPRDSRLEDAVVIFTSGSAAQIQEGVITVNIFVNDIDLWGNGQYVEDGSRCEEIEGLAQQWADTLTADRSLYYFELADAISTNHDADLRQSFVVVRLRYRYYAG